MATVEHELVAFIGGQKEATLKDMVESFGTPRGLSRGTIVKMADRLLKKGLVQRRLVEHVFRYSLVRPLEDVESGYVEKFVDARLGGDVTPLLGFLSEATVMTDEERQLLQEMANRLKGEKEA